MQSKGDCSRSNAAYSIEEESESPSEAARSRSAMLADFRSQAYPLIQQNLQTSGKADQNIKSGVSIDRALSAVQHRGSLRNNGALHSSI